VSVAQSRAISYPEDAPFHPHQRYSELGFSDLSPKPNQVYDLVRLSLIQLGLDDKNSGDVRWSPFRNLIQPGETVFIKPNLIAESVQNDPARWNFVITHGSILRPIIDYIYKALSGEGKIIIGDGPQTDSDMNLILNRSGIPSIQDWYWTQRRFEIQFMDLRNEFWVNRDGVIVDAVKLPGDPRGNLIFNLGRESYFSECEQVKRTYYGAYYDTEETNRHHTDGKHEYLVCRTPIEADVFINMPKLKTHKKTGMTLNLKNLVGINANKNWLPHYVLGSPETGGDQFDRRRLREKLEGSLVLKVKKILSGKHKWAQSVARKTRTLAYRAFGGSDDTIRSGNWHGNDTCWRMALDLNTILLYGDVDGRLKRKESQKRCFSVVDGVIGMDGDGPRAGRPFPSGVVIAGRDPLSVDLVAAKLIGFAYQKIPILCRAFDESPHPIWAFAYDDIPVISNEPLFNKTLKDINPADTLHFRPHFAWKNHIEI